VVKCCFGENPEYLCPPNRKWNYFSSFSKTVRDTMLDSKEVRKDFIGNQPLAFDWNYEL